jgi:hypothetical protein
MKSEKTFTRRGVALPSIVLFSATLGFGDDGQQRDSLRGLRRAIAEANATALSADQETQINTLLSAYKAAPPDGEDDVLEAAREAFDNAVLAGDLAAAQTQAAILANRASTLTAGRLQAEAVFEIGVLAALKSGGQLDPLIQKFGNERVLGLMDSIIGRSFGDGPSWMNPPTR